MKTIESELNAIQGSFSNGLLPETAPMDSSLTAEAESEAADCGLGGGGGICIVLDLIPETSTVNVHLDDCKFTANDASVGGNSSASYFVGLL